MFVTQAPHIKVQVQKPAVLVQLLIQLPINAHSKATEGGLSSCAPDTHRGDLDGLSYSWSSLSHWCLLEGTQPTKDLFLSPPFILFARIS